MDRERFDLLSRVLANSGNRREAVGALALLLGGGLTASAVNAEAAANAAKKKKPKCRPACKKTETCIRGSCFKKCPTVTPCPNLTRCGGVSSLCVCARSIATNKPICGGPPARPKTCQEDSDCKPGQVCAGAPGCGGINQCVVPCPT